MLCDMKLRLGGRDHAEGDFIVWSMAADRSPEGVADAIRDGQVVNAGTNPPVAVVQEAVAAGHHVLVSVEGEGDGDGVDPGMLAVVSVYAWLGARLFRVPEPALPAVRQVLDMVASIQGVRPPTLSRRGLA